MLSQVALAVRRAGEYAALHGKANRDKRVAIVFYNYPAGKSNIGASYLNVAESIGNVLRRLKQEGYDVGNADLSGDSVLKTLVEKSRNVGGYAPGELEALVAQGTAVRVGIAEYRRWLDARSPILKARVIKDWGEPGKSR
jgi:cobaltochelatase CobN